jgi:hypothetical protein
VGILSSGPKQQETEVTASRQRVSDLTPNSIGDRRTFFIPTTKQVNMNLRVVIIKDPQDEDIQLARSQMNRFVERTPRIVLNQVFDVSGTYGLEILDGEGTEVNQTQNRGLRKELILNLAENAALIFKETILDVY